VAAPFIQTTRALASERSHSTLIGLGAVLLVLAGWLIWFFGARVVVYETSQAARIEADRAAHAVDATVGGRIVAFHLALGASVAAGDVLVEIDSETQKRQLMAEKTRLAMMAPEVDALRRVLDARERSLQRDREATLTAMEEGRARQHEAEISAEYEKGELDRATRLFDGGLMSEMDLTRIKADARQRAAESEAMGLGVVRQMREQRTRDSRGVADLEDLRRELATVEGRQATTSATIDELAVEIDKRTIRAPIAGRIADVATVTEGAFVKEGDKLGAIVPQGDLRVVAQLAPFTAIGRVSPGQHARIRLDGYPWTQYGELHGSVTNVANEVRQGQVRVELTVLPDPRWRVPLQHGMTCLVEIEVEQVTPASLVLRAAGKVIHRTDPTGSEPAGSTQGS
jgi:membrane fusion protein (multidrug efflux system)